MNLLEDTMGLLAKCSLRSEQIAAGAQVPLYWLLKVRSQWRTGKRVNPRVEQLQKLHDFLVLASRQKNAENEGASGGRIRRRAMVAA